MTTDNVTDASEKVFTPRAKSIGLSDIKVNQGLASQTRCIGRSPTSQFFYRHEKHKQTDFHGNEVGRVVLTRHTGLV